MTDELMDIFYEELQKVIDYIREENEQIIVMGDWNSKVGNEQSEDAWEIWRRYN